MKKILLLSVFVFLFIISISSQAFARIIANSNNWRDVYILMIYSYYSNESFNFINSLGEAEILSKTLRKNDSILIFESRTNSIVKGYADFLKLKGFENVREDIFLDYTSLQIDLYKVLQKKILGFIVVKDDFGIDAISIAPYAINNNYWVFFYNDETKEDIIKTIKSNENKKVIFYGEFLDRPWKKIENPVMIIDEKSRVKNNMKILEMLQPFLNNNSWLIISNGEYIDEIFLIQKMPISFTLQTVEDITNWAIKNNIKIVEIIGPENVDYGQKIRDLSNRTVGVVVKTGRTFTGDPELRGKQFVIRAISTDYPIDRIVIEDIYFIPELKQLIIVVKNIGNTDLYYYISGIGAFYGDREIFPQFSPELHAIGKNTRFSLPIHVDLNETPDRVELLLTFGSEFPLKNTLENKIFDVEELSLEDKFNISILEAYYDIFEERIEIVLLNNDDKEVYAALEIFDIEILGLNRTLLSNIIKIPPKGKSTLAFKIMLDPEEIEKNKNINIRLFSGRDSSLLIMSSKHTVALQPKKVLITSLITMLTSNMLFVILVLILIIIFLLLFIFLKRRKKKEEKGLDGVGG